MSEESGKREEVYFSNTKRAVSSIDIKKEGKTEKIPIISSVVVLFFIFLE